MPAPIVLPKMAGRQVGAPKIFGFSASATVICGCGNPTPIHVSFVTGLNLESHCKACGGKNLIASIAYDFQKPGELQIGVAYMEPAIVRPQG